MKKFLLTVHSRSTWWFSNNQEALGKSRIKRLLKSDYSKDCKLKRSIITIRNVDNLCCARALAVGLAMVQRHPKLKQIKLGKNIQKEFAVELCRKANVAFGPCGLGEIARFQGILGEYQIVIIDFHARNGVIYEGPSRGKKIVLYKNGDHYVVNPDKMRNVFIVTYAKRFYRDICKVFSNTYFHLPYTRDAMRTKSRIEFIYLFIYSPRK